ncbi:MAG: HDOD domain-containing protein [Chitinivibrionales bacterium]|nr:HDOD domain-containing protein [Chitinivibrionales bacterium]
MRTRDIAVLVSVTAEVRQALDAIRQGTTPPGEEQERDRLQIIEYPFHFSQMVAKIDEMLADKEKERGTSEEQFGTDSTSGGGMLLNSQVPVDTKLRELETAMRQRWAFPFTVVRALDIMNSGCGGRSELATCIESDAAATTAILGIANRTQFAKRSGRVSSVAEAIGRIGFRETREILVAMSLIDIGSEIHRKYGFTRTDFWMHSLSTAIIASELCFRRGHLRPELAFVAGLIHDIGKIPVDNAFDHVFTRLLEDTTNHIAPFYESEYALMGFTHAECGHFFTSAWNFPSQIATAILRHHNPGAILSCAVANERMIQEAVFVANILAKALTMGHSCDEVLGEIPAAMLRELSMRKGPDHGFVENVQKRLKEYYNYLRLSAAEVAISNPGLFGKDFEVLVVCGGSAGFHPLALALETNGYTVHYAKEVPDRLSTKIKILLFIPDKGSPLDVTVGGTQPLSIQGGHRNCLRVFLLDDLDTNAPKREFAGSDIVLMDRHRVDMRLVLHVMEDYCYAVSMKGGTIGQ